MIKEEIEYCELSRKLKSQKGLTYDDRRKYFNLKKKIWQNRYDTHQITIYTLDNIIKSIDSSLKKIEKYNPHIIPLEEVMRNNYDDEF